MEEFEKLIEILEASVKKNGADKPITLGHLLNIVKKAQKTLIKEDFESDLETYTDDGWGDR